MSIAEVTEKVTICQQDGCEANLELTQERHNGLCMMHLQSFRMFTAAQAEQKSNEELGRAVVTILETVKRIFK